MELLNIESVCVYLRAEGFLSDNDMEKLNPNPPRYVGSQIVETLAVLVRKKGQTGLEKFLSALRKSANTGDQPGHEELLQLLENDCKDRSSITQSAEMNVSQKEDDPQSNDQVAQVDLEDCHEPNILALEAPWEDPSEGILPLHA